ncbi:hypothetical protein GUY44_07030 [Pimelobacter simplex]|nr:hypothetical protein [Pimelobacter simplex]MCG8150225.1 hypothetical protein [Pimelobacter simplex]GEB13565.1 hypothetical protein NSI01_18800 [Pimelobacter simplex]SFM71665.1 hypothetical protein SAMN05421671_3107 [Pimelobacter simplex]
MTTSPDPTNQPNDCVPECVPDCVPTGARAPRESSASHVPHSYEGDALSEPSRDALASASPRQDEHHPPPGFSTGSQWLLTPRCRPAWIAILDLLDDDQWHPTTDLAQLMRNTADLNDQTIRNHLRSASRRGWITTRRGRTRLRDRNLIETALNATDPEHHDDVDGLRPDAPGDGPGHLLGVARGGMVGDARKRGRESGGQVLTARSASATALLAQLEALRLQLRDVEENRNDLARKVADQRATLDALVGAARHPFKGPNDTDASMLLAAAQRLDGGDEPGGSHTKQTVARVLRVVAGAVAAEGA